MTSQRVSGIQSEHSQIRKQMWCNDAWNSIRGRRKTSIHRAPHIFTYASAPRSKESQLCDPGHTKVHASVMSFTSIHLNSPQARGRTKA
jgi:hypothetical protein